jgi:DNA repair protein RadC
MLRPVKEEITIPVCRIERSIDANNVVCMVLDSLQVCDLGIQECFGVMSLNRNNTVISCDVLFVGGLHSVVTDVKMILKCAILNGASGMIVFHNHPSGNLSPSQEDRKMTQKIRRVGVDLELPLLDHIILAPNGSYYSFADEGTLDRG